MKEQIIKAVMKTMKKGTATNFGIKEAVCEVFPYDAGYNQFGYSLRGTGKTHAIAKANLRKCLSNWIDAIS